MAMRAVPRLNLMAMLALPRLNLMAMVAYPGLTSWPWLRLQVHNGDYVVMYVEGQYCTTLCYCMAVLYRAVGVMYSSGVVLAILRHVLECRRPVTHNTVHMPAGCMQSLFAAGTVPLVTIPSSKSLTPRTCQLALSCY